MIDEEPLYENTNARGVPDTRNEVSFHPEIIRIGSGNRQVLALHAAGTGAFSLARLAGQLDKDCTVHLLNLHGYGKSRADSLMVDAPPLEQHLALIRLALSEIATAHWRLIGHSMGGLLALKIAMERASVVESVVAIEPTCHSALNLDADADVLAIDGNLIECLRENLLSGTVHRGLMSFIDYWNEVRWLDMSPDTRLRIASLGNQIAREVIAVSSDNTEKGEFCRIGCPVILICGTATNPIARRIVDRLSELMPHARVGEIKGAKHMLPITHPDETARQVNEFWRACELTDR